MVGSDRWLECIYLGLTELDLGVQLLCGYPVKISHQSFESCQRLERKEIDNLNKNIQDTKLALINSCHNKIV